MVNADDVAHVGQSVVDKVPTQVGTLTTQTRTS